MNDRLNIALHTKSFLRWSGGVDFLRNCANALLSQRRGDGMTLSLLFPEPTAMGKVIDFLQPYKAFFDALIRFRRPTFYRTKPIEKEALTESLVGTNDTLFAVSCRDGQRNLAMCLNKIKADVIVPLLEAPGRSFTVPWVGYIPDLQHKQLPHFFSKRERLMRDRVFSGILRNAKAVIVNSRSVKTDVEKYYTDVRCRIFPLPFAPVPLPRWFDDDPSGYKRKYGLPDRYFILSNQFWIHKSHITAFEALDNLRKISPASEFHLVCTGRTGDYRFPKYFQMLQSRVKEMKLSDSIRFLGYIPKNDQLQIMRAAVALLQPTLCEGGPGGGAVYDAVALGIPAIVSDIPVNKEIQGENVLFFRAGSSDDMTKKMLDLWKGNVERPSKATLLEEGRQRANRLGNALLEAIEFVVSYSPQASSNVR